MLDAGPASPLGLPPQRKACEGEQHAACDAWSQFPVTTLDRDCPHDWPGDEDDRREQTERERPPVLPFGIGFVAIRDTFKRDLPQAPLYERTFGVSARLHAAAA